MRALVFKSADPTQPPVWASDVPTPRAADADVLVRVHAAGLNRADLQRRAAFYGGEATALHIAGLEMAGEVVEIGRAVTRHRVGDKVMAAVGSACADYVVVHECMACPVPEGFSWTQAAATYVCISTAYDALIRHAKFKPRQTVLVQGATSGVGIAAVQLARAFGAGRIVGSSRSSEKLHKLRSLGLDDGIVHGNARTEGGASLDASFDIVLDLVGSSAAASCVAALAHAGRWVSVGRLTAEPAHVDLGALAHKGASLIGLASRMRTKQQHADVIDDLLSTTSGLWEVGKLNPVIDRVFSAQDAGDAFQYASHGEHFGKVVVSLDNAA